MPEPHPTAPTITASLPVWRTNPAGFDKSGYWPILTGALSVMVFVPLIGGLLSLITAWPESDTLLSGMAVILTFSFFISWAPLLVAIPVSAALAKRGCAGWGVALLGGFVAGGVTVLVLEGGVPVTIEALFFPMIGVFFAAIYWLSIRLVHPTAIGVTTRYTQ